MDSNKNITRSFLVYQHKNIVTGKMYIGVTCKGIERRLRQHMYAGKAGSNLPFHRALEKYGVALFESTVLFDNLTQEDALRKEVFAIAKYKTRSPFGYNATDGGDGIIGLSKEDVAKRGVMIGVALKGRKLSKETILKLVIQRSDPVWRERNRVSQIEAQTRPDVVVKKRIAATGKIASDSVKKKMSESQKMRWSNKDYSEARKLLFNTIEYKAVRKAIAMEQFKSKRVLCIDTGEIFDCPSDAARWLRSNGFPKATPGNIGKYCREKIDRPIYSHKWLYAD